MSTNLDQKITDMYDWIVDVDLITNINKNGWKMNFSKGFLTKNNLNCDKVL